MANKRNSRRSAKRREMRTLHPHYRASRPGRQPQVNIPAVALAALRNADAVVADLLPGGRRNGQEYIVLNPRRNDHKPGSFSINLTTGRWADFATTARGGDLVSLLAYVRGCDQVEAARELMTTLGVPG